MHILRLTNVFCHTENDVKVFQSSSHLKIISSYDHCGNLLEIVKFKNYKAFLYIPFY